MRCGVRSSKCLAPRRHWIFDASVANARTIPSLESVDSPMPRSLRPGARFPVSKPLTREPVHGPRIQYGSTFEVGGLRVSWAAGTRPTELWEHVASFPRGPLRIGTVTFAAHSGTAFVFALDQTLPVMASADGRASTPSTCRPHRSA